MGISLGHPLLNLLRQTHGLLRGHSTWGFSGVSYFHMPDIRRDGGF